MKNRLKNYIESQNIKEKKIQRHFGFCDAREISTT